VTLKTRGNSTHSSRPLPDSALAHLTRALHRIERYEPATPRPGATARRYLRAWAKGFGGRTARELRTFLAAKTAKARRRTARPLTRGSFGELFNGLLRTIYVPTIVSGGFRANVLPGSAEATVNIRLLPGARPRPAIRELERVIADKRVKVAPISPKGETAAETLKRFDERAKQRPSSIDTDLYRVLAREGKQEWPTAKVAPALFEAGTDAVPWRERGIPVYGVYPYPISRAELADMHGNDERISIRRLEEGTDMLTRVLRGAAAR
jgi:acetylornithine deacetylase/succinyl-diaminopimelate desuccinylase-like protein